MAISSLTLKGEFMFTRIFSVSTYIR